MVREVGVHYDDEVARDKLQAMDVGGAEAQLAGARLEDDMRGAEGGLEFFGAGERAVGGCVVDNYYFPIKFSAGICLSGCTREGVKSERENWEAYSFVNTSCSICTRTGRFWRSL